MNKHTGPALTLATARSHHAGEADAALRELVRAMARAQAAADHERETKAHDQARSDLRPLFQR